MLLPLVKDVPDKIRILGQEHDLEEDIYRRNILKFLFVIGPLMTQIGDSDELCEHEISALMNENLFE